VVHTAVERAFTPQSLESTSVAVTTGLRRQSLLYQQYEIWFGLDYEATMKRHVRTTATRGTLPQLDEFHHHLALNT
jgi:hypothetical protein